MAWLGEYDWEARFETLKHIKFLLEKYFTNLYLLPNDKSINDLMIEVKQQALEPLENYLKKKYFTTPKDRIKLQNTYGNWISDRADETAKQLDVLNLSNCATLVLEAKQESESYLLYDLGPIPMNNEVEEEPGDEFPCYKKGCAKVFDTPLGAEMHCRKKKRKKKFEEI
jgi:hypothetical protein